jgi:hypothetical protein
MKVKKLFKPGNRRARVLVGLLLAGLFTVQIARTDALREFTSTSAISGEIVGAAAPETLSRLEKLAKTDHIALLEYCLENYRANFKSYTATLVKQERIRGVIGKEQTVDVKFMQQPFSVAMKWTENPSQADRIIYVDGKYDNKMMVRPANGLIRALFPAVLRDPRCKDAKAASLRTIDQFGFENSIMSLLKVYRQAKKQNHLKEDFGGYAEVAGRKAIVLIRYLPPENNYLAHKTVIFIDLESMVPICVEAYGWGNSPELIFRYVHKNLKLNVHMTDEDFLPETNDIKYKR